MPTYSKPKKPKKPGSRTSQVTGGQATGRFTPPKPVTTPRPGGQPPVAPRPAAAAPAATRPANFTPPATTRGAQLRSQAEGTYQAALRQGRQGIVSAALRLGSPEIINALKADPNFAEYIAVLDKGTADPSSQFAIAAADEKEGLEAVDVNANAGNTFFSGRRLKDRSNLTEDFNNARLGYTRDYHDAFNALMGNMGTAKGDYERALSDADYADFEAWLASQPAPTGPDTQPVAPPPPSGNSQAQEQARYEQAQAQARARRNAALRRARRRGG